MESRGGMAEGGEGTSQAAGQKETAFPPERRVSPGVGRTRIPGNRGGEGRGP